MRRPSQLAPLLLSALFVTHPSLPCIAADAPPAAPTTQPDPASNRLTFLTLQLSSTEASLSAVNTALRNAGYKSVNSANTAEFYAHNNADLDRNGGGPIAWDKFYGKTAKEFAPRDIYGVPHNYDRPAQFDYMYKANNDLIAKANADVANLGKKIDDLLARRRQLDAEQSALWAKISWESIQNHDIALNALYRFQLKVIASTPAADARRDILRPTILFLRTIDKIVGDDLDSLSINQEATLSDLKDRTQSAYDAAKEPLANAMLSADLSTDDLKTAKDLLASIKRFPELAKNITESYHLALDGDAAHDDNRKLTFRAQLQSALLDFATATTDLDYQLNSLAKSWGLEPQKGAANPDTIPTSTTKITAAKISDAIPAAGDSNSVVQTNSDHPIDLISLIDTRKDTMTGSWHVKGSSLSCDPVVRGNAHIEIPYAPPLEYDFRVVFSRDHITLASGCTGFIVSQGNQQFMWLIGGTNNQVCGFSLVNGKKATDTSNPTYVKADKWIDENKRYVSTIKVRKNFVDAYLDDKLICHFNTDYSNIGLLKIYTLHDKNTLGINSEGSAINVESAEIIEITGQGKPLH